MAVALGSPIIATPVLAKTALYWKSGHLPYYEEGMYPFMDLVEQSLLRCSTFAIARSTRHKRSRASLPI